MAELVYFNEDLLNDSIQEVKTSLNITDPCTFTDILSQIKRSSGTAQITTSASSTTNATTASVQIDHGLGKIPDYIIFWKNSGPRGSISYRTTVSGKTVTRYYSYLEVLACIVDVKQNSTKGIYVLNTSISLYVSSGTLNYTPNSTVHYSSTDFDTATNTYVITEVNENNFTVPKNLLSGSTYNFIAW